MRTLVKNIRQRVNSIGGVITRHGTRAVSVSPWTLAIALFLLVLPACRLTDHQDAENEVSASDITFPTSGHEHIDPDDLPAISFDSLHRDMGQVVQGTSISKRFTFTNSGGAPLVISNVHSTCGCTVGKDWPKRPIPPGESGSIDVVFDSEGRNGRQEKTVTVVANTTPPSTVLTLTGEVVGPATTP